MGFWSKVFGGTPANSAATAPKPNHDLGAALYAAAKRGDLEAVRSLLARGAPAGASRQGGVTPLIVASNGGHVSVVMELIRAGASINHQTVDGHAALHFAVIEDQLDTINALLGKGADPDIAENDGITPLSLAASAGKLEIVRALLRGGANANKRTVSGDRTRTALEACQGKGFVEIEELLRSARATGDKHEDFDRTRHFRLGNCDFSPAMYETWDPDRVRSEIGIELQFRPDGYYTAAGECCSLRPTDTTNGWFALAFPHAGKRLQSIVVAKSYTGDFLGFADDCNDQLLAKLSFREIGVRKDVEGFTVWRSEENANVYLSIHRNKQGRLVEVYYDWCTQEYDDLVR